MFEPLFIENYFPYEEITIVFPVDNGNGLEVGTSKALLFMPGIAVIYDNGHAVVEHVTLSKLFGDKYYEVADGYRFSLAEFYYSDEMQVYDVADMITLMVTEYEEMAEQLAG